MVPEGGDLSFGEAPSVVGHRTAAGGYWSSGESGLESEAASSHPLPVLGAVCLCCSCSRAQHGKLLLPRLIRGELGVCLGKSL